jgi:hypothetical protein
LFFEAFYHYPYGKDFSLAEITKCCESSYTNFAGKVKNFISQIVK